jgi:hypothetical protein
MKTTRFNLQTATLSQLINRASKWQLLIAEKRATKALSKINDPVCGAREILIAQNLRKEMQRH